jgi:hypothetical protein
MLRRLREWLRIGSLDRAEHATEERQPVENLDATAAGIKHQSDLFGPVSGTRPATSRATTRAVPAIS